MRKLLAVALLLSCAVSAVAADSLESVRAASSFSALPGAAALKTLKFGGGLRALNAREPQPAKTKGARLMRLSGYLNLTGSGFHNGNSGFENIQVSGWTTLREDNGSPVNGSVYMTGSAMVSVNGSFASGWATPQAYVTISQNGKPLGTMLIQGNVSVSGFVNGSWINVNGYGPVSGQMWVDQ
jgi:hypothetical protein